ncbi:hypothetical protein N7495_003751 [Penicillium taxi]|uniref:uncharacterized protein n=1 Tax=Penicillium taxi TaxID=168475 RepID=UPI0025451C24|nr:uncharacterized protein N7495_003751 [Penicillium taxi]KAJ5899007.1 hypothetical protein N7495_003751 [Penicillium taxi]
MVHASCALSWSNGLEITKSNSCGDWPPALKVISLWMGWSLLEQERAEDHEIQPIESDTPIRWNLQLTQPRKFTSFDI